MHIFFFTSENSSLLYRHFSGIIFDSFAFLRAHMSACGHVEQNVISCCSLEGLVAVAAWILIN